MCGEAKLKRKRGRPSKSRPPQATVLDHNGGSPSASSAAAEKDAAFSISNNVELINPAVSPSSSGHDGHRRGCPSKKNPKTDPPAGATNVKTVAMAVPPMINGAMPNEIGGVENAVARVVPAMDAVVKVFCVYTELNFSLPWQRKRQYSSSSSGFGKEGFNKRTIRGALHAG